VHRPGGLVTRHAAPEWWDRLPKGKPVVLSRGGSSGDRKATQTAIRALADMGITVMVATAGGSPARNFRKASMPRSSFPARRRRKGGPGDLQRRSGMVYQALSCGTPVLGIPFNVDQHFVMEAVRRKGAGRLIRAAKRRGPSSARRSGRCWGIHRTA